MSAPPVPPTTPKRGKLAKITTPKSSPQTAANPSPTKRSPRKKGPPPPSSAKLSTLNPEAGGFQPTTLSHTVDENAPGIGDYVRNGIFQQHLAIQSQIESLKAQQESLIAAFGDLSVGYQPQLGQALQGIGQMPPMSAPMTGQQGQMLPPKLGHGHSGSFSSSAGAPAHRRGQSHGSFSHGRKNSSSAFWTVTDGEYYTHNRRQLSVSGSTAAADAQAHLDQLASYRFATGPGHNRTGSQTVPAQVGPGGQVRKTLFVPYLPQGSISPLVGIGKLWVGVLRVNKRNRSDAYVTVEGLGEVYVCGSKDRNRALEGDSVAVELLDVDQVWTMKKEKEDKKRKKDADAGVEAERRRAEKLRDDIEVEGQVMGIFEEDDVNEDVKPKFTGHVVGIVERAPGQIFSGSLSVSRPSSVVAGGGARGAEPPKIVWFRPTDKRVPLIAIPTEQAPGDFLEKAEAYANTVFVASIKRWPITSLHPFGNLVETVGRVGDVEAETRAVLRDAGVGDEIFPEIELVEPETVERKTVEGAVALLPDDGENVFVAFTARRVEDGIEVGTHVSDVAAFVASGSVADREMRKRAMAIQLVDRLIPLAPPAVVDRARFVDGLARECVSVTMTLKDGKPTAVWTGRTLVAPTLVPIASLGEMDEATDAAKTVALLTEVSADTQVEPILDVIVQDSKPVDCRPRVGVLGRRITRHLTTLANKVLAKRLVGSVADGALLCSQPRPDFDALAKRLEAKGVNFDPDRVSDLSEGERAVVAAEVRKVAVHEEWLWPAGADLAKFAHYGAGVGVFCRFENPIGRYSDLVVIRQIFGEVASRPKEQAAAVVESATESEPNGVEDAVPAPVRPESPLSPKSPAKDKAAKGTGPIVKESIYVRDVDAVARVVGATNARATAARKASEGSVHLWTARLIRRLGRLGPVIREGVVSGVFAGGVQVVVPEFGIEKRVRECVKRDGDYDPYNVGAGTDGPNGMVLDGDEDVAELHLSSIQFGKSFSGVGAGAGTAKGGSKKSMAALKVGDFVSVCVGVDCTKSPAVIKLWLA